MSHPLAEALVLSVKRLQRHAPLAVAVTYTAQIGDRKDSIEEEDISMGRISFVNKVALAGYIQNEASPMRSTRVKDCGIALSCLRHGITHALNTLPSMRLESLGRACAAMQFGGAITFFDSAYRMN